MRLRDLQTKLRMLWCYLRHDPIGFARAAGVRIGTDCRIETMRWFGSEPWLIRIGNHVTIAQRVICLTHDGGVWVFREERPNIDIFGEVVVGNNVFIGYGAIILPGVTIGNDCVVAAGAVVTRDIPPGYVAAGVPARCIKTIGEYWETIERKGLSEIRSLPLEQKREYLVRMFAERGPKTDGAPKSQCP